GGIRAHQMREMPLNLLVAPSQRVIVSVRNGRRVLLIIASVVLGYLGGKPLELGRGLRLVQVSDRDFAVGRVHSFHFGRAVSRRPGMTTNHPAARIRRSAAARASAVISAPASMRAISSRRFSAETSTTPVATRLPFSTALLLIKS